MRMTREVPLLVRRTGAWFDGSAVAETRERTVTWTVTATDDVSFRATSMDSRPLDPPPGVRRSPALDGGPR